MKIGIVDTTFSRVNMGAIAEAKLILLNTSAKIIRSTVPGIKDLPVACHRLFTEGYCEIIIACGMVGPEEVDKICGHEASTAIQQVQLAAGKHILEVFVHMDEATDEGDLLQLTTNRVEKHCENAIALMQGKTALTPSAGTGKRQGRDDAGPVPASKAATKQYAEKQAIRLGIVVADFNSEVTHMMEEEAKRTAKEKHAEVIAVLHVPGAYDMPLAVQAILQRQDIDAVCAYGAIITGETSHDQVIGHATAKTLQELSLKFHKPIGFGIAGPGMTYAQAAARGKEYGRRAVEAAIKLCEIKLWCHDKPNMTNTTTIMTNQT